MLSYFHKTSLIVNKLIPGNGAKKLDHCRKRTGSRSIDKKTVLKDQSNLSSPFYQKMLSNNLIKDLI